jgi:hypothetical protein
LCQPGAAADCAVGSADAAKAAEAVPAVSKPATAILAAILLVHIPFLPKVDLRERFAQSVVTMFSRRIREACGQLPPHGRVLRGTRDAEWAGHSLEVLYKVYAKCLHGREKAAQQRIQDAMR